LCDDRVPPREQSGKTRLFDARGYEYGLTPNGFIVTISDQRRKEEIARFVRDGLAQQLTGILLAAKALTRGLEDRQAREAVDADRLVKLLRAANKEVEILLHRLR
jgi:hypothetical protein